MLATWALGLGGRGQTLGRIRYTPLAARARASVLIAASRATTFALAATPGLAALLITLPILAGAVGGNRNSSKPPWGTACYRTTERPPGRPWPPWSLPSPHGQAQS